MDNSGGEKQCVLNEQRKLSKPQKKGLLSWKALIRE